MANLEAVCGEVEGYLEARNVVGVARGVIMEILRNIEWSQIYIFEDCRVAQAVHARLRIGGFIKVSQVEITEAMLGKLELLGGGDAKLRRELAEIILWSDTFADVEEKVGAFEYGTDAYQTLLPAFRVLYSQPEVRERVIQSLQEKIGDQATVDIIDEYILRTGNQPYGIFPHRHPEIPLTIARSMMYLVMEVMLEIMKRYLMG